MDSHFWDLSRWFIPTNSQDKARARFELLHNTSVLPCGCWDFKSSDFTSHFNPAERRINNTFMLSSKPWQISHVNPWFLLFVDVRAGYRKCFLNRGGCAQICIPSTTSFKCACRTGWMLAADGFNCTGLCALYCCTSSIFILSQFPTVIWIKNSSWPIAKSRMRCLLGNPSTFEVEWHQLGTAQTGVSWQKLFILQSKGHNCSGCSEFFCKNQWPTDYAVNVNGCWKKCVLCTLHILFICIQSAGNWQFICYALAVYVDVYAVPSIPDICVTIVISE